MKICEDANCKREKTRRGLGGSCEGWITTAGHIPIVGNIRAASRCRSAAAADSAHSWEHWYDDGHDDGAAVATGVWHSRGDARSADAAAAATVAAVRCDPANSWTSD